MHLVRERWRHLIELWRELMLEVRHHSLRVMAWLAFPRQVVELLLHRVHLDVSLLLHVLLILIDHGRGEEALMLMDYGKRQMVWVVVELISVLVPPSILVISSAPSL